MRAVVIGDRQILVLVDRAVPTDLRDALLDAWDPGTRGLLGRLNADAPFEDRLPWASRHTVDGSDNPSPMHRMAARVLDAAGRQDGPPRAVRNDLWLRRAVRSSDVVVLAGASAGGLAALVHEYAPDVIVVDADAAAASLRGAEAWSRLRTVLAEQELPAEGEPVDGLLETLRGAGGVPAAPWTSGPDPARTLRPVLPVAHELARYGRHDDLEALIAAVGDLGGIGADDLLALGLTALERSTLISRNAEPLHAVRPPDMIEVARRTLEAADAALEDEAVDHAVDLAAAALRLVFNRDLHADVPETPLVDAPHDFLRLLTDTRVWGLLTSVQPRRPAPPRDADGQGRVRVLVLPGAYPHFATPLIRAIERHPDTEVEVVHLPDVHPYFRWVGINRHALGIRLRHALGLPVPQGEEVLETLDRADVVVADWADRGAMWASLMVPEGVRLVVRVHSMDSLSPWLQLLDWSSVDDVVFVSKPIRDLSVDALRERAPGGVHVIGNGIDMRRFAPDPDHVEHRTLGMVGWSRPVKDPLFALEVLERLLDRDPDGGWRLRLVGPDLQYGTVEQINAYRRAFHRRLLESGVSDHVDFVDQTPHVEQYVRGFGFILSTSVRESFHAAVVEGVAAGAVPVVRNWPILARRDGAAQIYPRDWIVEDVEEAVERIWALRDGAARSAAAVGTMAVAAERFSYESFTRAVQSVVVEPVLRERSGSAEVASGQAGEHLDRRGHVSGG